MKNLFCMLAKSDTVRPYLSQYQWYRKLYGGRWELWCIPMCAANLWLTIDKGYPDNYVQPCSAGPRIAREDW